MSTIQYKHLSETQTIASFLGCGINGLPSSKSRRQIRARHPNLIPDMEIPRGGAWRGAGRTPLSLWNELVSLSMGNGLYLIYHTESSLYSSKGVPSGFQWQSMVMLPSQSCAELKLVTLRHGSPRARDTVNRTWLSLMQRD